MPGVHSKLALGTAQFGLSYGIANQKGQISLGELKEILKFALSQGINTLDTAIAYGSSEERLGEACTKDWRIISKLPRLPSDITDIKSWVENSVSGSLKRLKIGSLDGLLLHHPHDLLTNPDDSLYRVIVQLKEQGKIKGFGISVYSPDELEDLFSRFDFDIVQAPLNLIDRRLIQSGWLSRLHRADVEVHTRSTFLQGLLLMEPLARPTYFDNWNQLWELFRDWLMTSNLTPLEACLGFVLNNHEIDRVVIGVDSLAQLQEILKVSKLRSGDVPEEISSSDLNLVNPTRWSL
jgi:aryl-alcohol dehydrogenase-like predicted oxidoreductase